MSFQLQAKLALSSPYLDDHERKQTFKTARDTAWETNYSALGSKQTRGNHLTESQASAYTSGCPNFPKHPSSHLGRSIAAFEIVAH
jgi:hypothetical protein